MDDIFTLQGSIARAYDKAGLWGFRSPYFLQIDPLFDNLRNDAEFKEMPRRVLAEKAQLRGGSGSWRRRENCKLLTSLKRRMCHR